MEGVGLTFDYWSQNSDSYITETAHFIDEDFNCHNYVLDTIETNDSHTAAYTREVIEKIHIEYGIDQKVVDFTTDGGKNVINAA